MNSLLLVWLCFYVLECITGRAINQTTRSPCYGLCGKIVKYDTMDFKICEKKCPDCSSVILNDDIVNEGYIDLHGNNRSCRHLCHLPENVLVAFECLDKCSAVWCKLYWMDGNVSAGNEGNLENSHEQIANANATFKQYVETGHRMQNNHEVKPSAAWLFLVFGMVVVYYAVHRRYCCCSRNTHGVSHTGSSEQRAHDRQQAISNNLPMHQSSPLVHLTRGKKSFSISRVHPDDQSGSGEEQLAQNDQIQKKVSSEIAKDGNEAGMSACSKDRLLDKNQEDETSLKDQVRAPNEQVNVGEGLDGYDDGNVEDCDGDDDQTVPKVVENQSIKESDSMKCIHHDLLHFPSKLNSVPVPCPSHSGFHTSSAEPEDMNSCNPVHSQGSAAYAVPIAGPYLHSVDLSLHLPLDIASTAGAAVEPENLSSTPVQVTPCEILDVSRSPSEVDPSSF